MTMTCKTCCGGTTVALRDCAAFDRDIPDQFWVTAQGIGDKPCTHFTCAQPFYCYGCSAYNSTWLFKHCNHNSGSPVGDVPDYYPNDCEFGVTPATCGKMRYVYDAHEDEFPYGDGSPGSSCNDGAFTHCSGRPSEDTVFFNGGIVGSGCTSCVFDPEIGGHIGPCIGDAVFGPSAEHEDWRHEFVCFHPFFGTLAGEYVSAFTLHSPVWCGLVGGGGAAFALFIKRWGIVPPAGPAREAYKDAIVTQMVNGFTLAPSNPEFVNTCDISGGTVTAVGAAF